MAPRWPQVNNGPEHINEHATYLKEACDQLQAVDRGRHNQVPWSIVQPYMESTIALIGKVLRQPALAEVLQRVQDAAKCTQNIQKDVTIIKNSVGLSTTPLNAANFGRTRNTATTWAQVAAQAKSSPPPPPPAPQGGSATRTQAYKDRVVTVKLKDHGIAQRYRAQTAAWIRQQVETAIRDNTATKQVTVVAAHQLKSGDIQIFTSTTTEARQLTQSKGWLGGLGQHAELIVPTYGIIVHGILTSTINIKDQKAVIQQMLADNHTVIPNAQISYIGWLTKEATLKRASSIVVEFTDPEMANAVIYAGMAWEGQIHQCQLYDRACRVKQCFRCYNYGHIGTQCNASQTCGYCAELHETRNCKQKGVEGFAPRCAVCKDAHTAWSNACPARKKEMRRVEEAKGARSIYWHVPVKEKVAAQEARITRNTTARQEPRSRVTIQTNAGERPEEVSLPIPDAGPPDLDISHRMSVEEEMTAEAQIRAETLPSSPIAPSIGEEWATPAMQRMTPRQTRLAIDPQLMAREGIFAPTSGNALRLPAQSPYPIGEDESAVLQEADAWLESLINSNDDNASEWVQDQGGDEISPPTTMVTDTHTAQGTIYKGCKCPEHQEIYSNWPTESAELTIARCMKLCVYCGKDFEITAELRKHMKKKHANRNITVALETRNRWGSSTPGWIHTEAPPIRRIQTRATRSQSPTYGTNADPHAC